MSEDNEPNEKDILEQIADMDFTLPESPLSREPADETTDTDPLHVWDLEGVDDDTEYRQDEVKKPKRWQELENILAEFHYKHRPRGKCISSIELPEELGIDTGFTENEGSILSYSPVSETSFDIIYRIDEVYGRDGKLGSLIEIAIDMTRETEGAGQVQNVVYRSNTLDTTVKVINMDNEHDTVNMMNVALIATIAEQILYSIEDHISHT